jgi:hypothetical protein
MGVEKGSEGISVNRQHDDEASSQCRGPAITARRAYSEGQYSHIKGWASFLPERQTWLRQKPLRLRQHR